MLHVQTLLAQAECHSWPRQGTARDNANPQAECMQGKTCMQPS
jgi:hypothetical protein